MIRHDAAHVLAEAVQELHPGTQVTIGPVIENGFYYDFFLNEPFSQADFPAIEKKMREIIQRDKPFTKSVSYFICIPSLVAFILLLINGILFLVMSNPCMVVHLSAIASIIQVLLR